VVSGPGGQGRSADASLDPGTDSGSDRGSGVEIERKFLVARPPEDLARHSHQAIAQGYLAIGDDGVEVRIRRTPAEALLTIKAGRGTVRLEEELPISEERFATLWPWTQGRRIEKVRYRVPTKGATIEVDVYDGALRGLVIAEVEFDSRAARDDFRPPGWLAADVSDDPRYKNQSLAVHGLPGRPEGEEPR
jgi:CYTH domain-containing protein